MLPPEDTSPPAPVAASAGEEPAAASGGSEPWVLRLGNSLSKPRAAEDDKGWAVKLGTYLSERQPGPWSLIANEKPQDPLVRCGLFFRTLSNCSTLYNLLI